ncbi:hypothetical protein HYU11_04020 [Candidatus Woesearchaeota archaeon]|nr:hypothetical protein [Candidatus Woesearchaeota archaeon]
MVIGIGSLIFRRGTGIFKLLFAIDDLIRLFTMTLVFFLGLTILDAGQTLMMLGVGLGLVIDIHDIFDDLKSGKPLDLGFG